MTHFVQKIWKMESNRQIIYTREDPFNAANTICTFHFLLGRKCQSIKKRTFGCSYRTRSVLFFVLLNRFLKKKKKMQRTEVLNKINSFENKTAAGGGLKGTGWGQRVLSVQTGRYKQPHNKWLWTMTMKTSPQQQYRNYHINVPGVCGMNGRLDARKILDKKQSPTGMSGRRLLWETQSGGGTKTLVPGSVHDADRARHE